LFLIGIPLLIIPFAIYNMVAFLMPGLDWTDKIATIPMMSGASWTITPEDALITLAILLLFIEIFKATRISSRGVVDHMLSMLLFVVMLVEFLLVPKAATSTFFLLMMLAFVDVIGGFTIAARAARRDIAVEESLLSADRG
jgi:hypothetical protein